MAIEMTTDVVVVGGGVVGAAAAYQLTLSNTRVVLVDAGHEGRATAAGAGIIAPGLSWRPSALYYPLSYKAASYYPTLIAQLSDDGAGETGYEVVGGLYIATDEREMIQLAILRRLLDDRAAAGVPNIGAVSSVSGREAKALFPALGQIAGALHMSGAARLNGRLLREALVQGARRRGAKVVEGHARLVCKGGYAKGIEVDGRMIPADAVIIAGGAWSNQFRESTGIDIPVKPQKGQILHIEMTEDTSRWPILLGFNAYYILTFPKRRVVVGATREDDSGYDTRVTVAGVQALAEEALRVAPSLADGILHEVRVGLRPDTPDHLPILGPVPGIRGLYLATGHGANGLTAGAYSGITVANQVMGNPVEVDVQPYSIARFFAKNI